MTPAERAARRERLAVVAETCLHASTVLACWLSDWAAERTEDPSERRALVVALEWTARRGRGEG